MQTQAIVDQAQEIVLKPKEAWTDLEKRRINLQDTYLNYVMPLAALPAVAHFLGMALIGVASGDAGHRAYIGFLPGILFALVSFGAYLGAVYVFAKIADWLGPQFGVTRNFEQAFKLAAYFPTAAFIVGVIRLIPDLDMFWYLGAGYSIYLLVLGIPVLMKPPADKAFTYTLAVACWAIILLLIVGIVLDLLSPPAIPRT